MRRALPHTSLCLSLYLLLNAIKVVYNIFGLQCTLKSNNNNNKNNTLKTIFRNLCLIFGPLASCVCHRWHVERGKGRAMQCSVAQSQFQIKYQFRFQPKWPVPVPVAVHSEPSN